MAFRWHLIKRKHACRLLLSAAFDTIDHKVLLDRLSHIGIQGRDIYAIERNQYVFTDRRHRTWKYGVPQGFVLSPVPFTL